MIGVEHEGMTGNKAKGIPKLFLCSDFVCGAELLNNGSVQTHAFFQLCGNHKTFAFEFCHLRTYVAPATGRQPIS